MREEADTQNNAWECEYEAPVQIQPRRDLMPPPYTYNMAAIAAAKGENK